LVSKTIKSFIYMGCGVNKLIFGITGTEEPQLLSPVECEPLIKDYCDLISKPKSFSQKAIPIKH
jgi:hypothetical protein